MGAEYGILLSQTQRANSTAREWEEYAQQCEQSAREWRAYAEKVQQALNLANDRLVGCSAVLENCKEELRTHLPQSPLNSTEYRVALRDDAINRDRVERRNLPALSESELKLI